MYFDNACGFVVTFLLQINTLNFFIAICKTLKRQRSGGIQYTILGFSISFSGTSTCPTSCVATDMPFNLPVP